jgi:hypothetical protein
MDADAYQRTVDVALEGEVITAEPAVDVYTTELAIAALNRLQDLDRTGADYQKENVLVTPGGE